MRTSTLLGAGLLAAALTLPGQALPDGDVQPYDPIPMYPVVVYDVSGATLAGPVSRNLVIYSNGHVQLSQAAGVASLPWAFASHLSQAELQRVIDALRPWSHLLDEQPQVADVPLQTLTTIGPQGNARSVSWYIGHQGHDHIENIVDGLLEEKFPQVID